MVHGETVRDDVRVKESGTPSERDLKNVLCSCNHLDDL